MALKPLGDRVIIKRDEAETVTASGLYLAQAATEKPQTGIVVAVGEGKLDKDGNLVTIEGNTGTGNDANGGAVMRRVRNPKYVTGACRPGYNM